MKGFKASMAVFCAAALMVFSAPSEAKVKITIKNKRSHNLSLAFCWSGFDLEDDRRSGWYIVKAGETRTITIKDATYFFTISGFGFYAIGDGKTWAGKEDGLEVIIDPKKSFSGHPDDPIRGGKKVRFRRVNLKPTDEELFHGSATLTFNP